MTVAFSQEIWYSWGKLELPGGNAMELGQRIKEARLEKGLSQQALSESCQVDRGFISSVERGVRNISVVTLCMIVNQLGMDFVSFAKWMDSSK